LTAVCHRGSSVTVRKGDEHKGKAKQDRYEVVGSESLMTFQVFHEESSIDRAGVFGSVISNTLLNSSGEELPRQIHTCENAD
jgi:hypothetical protein